jgi:primosomal protein N''
MDQEKRQRIARELYEDMSEVARAEFMEFVREATTEIRQAHDIEVSPEFVANFLLEHLVDDIHAVASEHITDEVKQRIVTEEHDRLRQVYPFGPVQAGELASAARARMRREYALHEFRSKR